MQYLKQTLLVLVVCLGAGIQANADTKITLEQAEQLALEHDAVLKVNEANAEAFFAQAVSEKTLPDPQIKFGLANFPTDTYRRDQEPMTQIQVGLQQMIPRGDTLDLKSRRAAASGEMANAMTENRRRMLILEVRNIYLEMLYWIYAEKEVKRSQELFGKLLDITQSQYATGQQRQQDVIRAELELALLYDRLDNIILQQDTTRAKLEKLTGKKFQTVSLEQNLPELSSIDLERDYLQHLQHHPLMLAENARVTNSQYAIELARQEYKPNWMVGVTYGFRDGKNLDGTDRADFVSAMVTLDVPLFTANRQDKNVAASRLRHQASLETREDRIRDLEQQYFETRSVRDRLGDRILRYQNTIVPQARENAKAALFAYQNRRGEFTALMRARITELETGLKQLRLRIDFLKAHAKLLYLLGEQL